MKNNYSTQNETNSKLDIRYSAILAKLRLKSFTLTLAIFVAAIGSVLGQIGGANGTYSYVSTQTTSTYASITGGTAHYSTTATSTDGVTAAVNIGFNFTFNNRVYSQVFISNNGFVTFGSATAATNYTPLSNTTVSAAFTYEGAISGFGANLAASTVTGAAPEVRSQLTGTAPNRIFIIQYKDIKGSGAATAQRLTFQIQLKETSNVIDIVYGSGNASGTANLLGQVGVRGSSQSDYSNRTGTNWTTAALGTLNTNQITLGTTNGTTVPAVNLCYRFTPPPAMAAPTYASLPYTENFNTDPWSAGSWLQSLPSTTSVRTWPGRGDNSWRRDNVSTANSGWTSTTGGYTVATPAASGTARFHSFDTRAGIKGNMDFYLNFSAVGTKVLTFDYFNAAGTDNLVVQLSTDGGATFGSALSTLTTSTAWTTQTINLGSSTSTTCVVRLVATSDWGTAPADIGVDNVSITVPTPACATTPSPSNAATGVAQLPTLSWAAVSGATGYDVYFGATSGALSLVSTNQAGTSYSPASLSASTPYYWRVVPVNTYGNRATGCTEWSFTTTAPVPTVAVGTLTAFGNQCINTTSTAGSFTVSGINLTGNVDIAALSGYTYCATVGGTYTSTLSIPASGTLASTNVYVKFSPTAASTYSGNIVVSSTGATSANVAASGTGINTTISTQPSSATATYCPSAAATALTVAATAAGGSSFSYQWYSNTSASTIGGTTVGTNATSYTPLTTSNGTLYYYCVVSGCGTSATSTVSGAITTGACINMSTGSTTLTGNTNFYDNGGPSADYTNSQSLTYTVYPASCNNVRAVFSSIATEACCDNLKIYNGNSAAAPLIGTYTTTSPGTITSTAEDGSLTFVFTSDGSVVAAGFAAVLSNVPITTGPAQPSAITGTLNPEVGSSQTYSVTNVSGVTYTWSFPSGWSITNGQGTNSVTVTVGGTNSTISCTPSKCGYNGTASTATTTIPNYRWAYVSSSLGSATWTGGEARNVEITIKNTGVGTWNSGVTTNVAIRWDSDNSNAAFSPWDDYHSRVTAGNVAPGAQATYSIPIQAKNATGGPTYGVNLADGTYYLAFDLVNEGSCWFGGSAGGAGACAAGNTPWYSSAQTVSTTPTISCSALTAFGSVCTNATPTNTFTISGVNLTNNVSVGTLTGYTYSTTSNGTYTSTLSLTPSSGSLNQTVYVKFTPTAATAYSGSISVTSTGATGQSVSVSGTGIAAPTVNAGSDVSICSGQSIALSGSTNATSSSGSASATYSAGNASTLYSASPTTATISSCPIPLSVTIPVGAVITGVNVSYTMTAASNGWMADQRSYVRCTNAGGSTESAISSGTGNAIGSLPYSRNNLTIANGVSGGGTINFQLHAFRTYSGTTCTTTDNYVNNNTFIVTVNYTINPTYSWSPSTGLSASNVLSPNCSATSTTTYTLTVTNTDGCSSSDQVVATVAGSAPAAPTASVSGSSTINVGGTTTLTSSAGANTLWFEAASNGTSVGSGDNWQTPVQCTSGTKTYYAENNNGTCASPSRTAVTFTVRSMVAENPSNGLICTAGGSVTLSAQLTGGSSIAWSPNTNLSATSGASTIASPTVTTVYTMNATVAGCGSVSETATVGVIEGVPITPTSNPTSVCAGGTAVLSSNLNASNFTSSSITCNLSAVPTSGVTTLCSGGTANVSTTSTTGGTYPLDDAGWGNIPIGFTYNFFGNNYTSLNVGTNGMVQFGTYNSTDLADFIFTSLPNAAEPQNVIAIAASDYNLSSGASSYIKYWTEGTAPTQVFVLYYYQVLQYSAGPGYTTGQIKLYQTTGNVEIHISASTSTNNKVVGLQNNILVNGTPTGAQTFSSTGNITNQAWKFVPGANYSFQWATAGSNISGAQSTTYTTPALNTPGTVSYTVAATNPNTQCASTGTVNITVNSLPAAPVSLGDVTACNTAGSQNLVVSAGAGETADWYNASTAGTLLTNNNTTHATATAGTYFAEAENTTTGCKSATRTAVTLTTNNAPSAPTASGASYCQGATATALSASAPSGSNTQSWYTVAVGGTPLAGAPTPSTASAGTTNFYVSETSGSNGCESTRTLVSVTVNATPAAPSASNPGAYCQNETASALSATSDGSSTLYWYTVPTGGTGSTTAITPSTSAAGTATYYVSQLSASNCESSRTAITVTVNPTITASVSNSPSSTSACGGNAITFTATPTNGGTPTYQWYLNGNPVGGNSATYTTNQASDNAGNYSGTWNNGSNQGSGMGAWSFNVGANSGQFIGNPSSDGNGIAGIGSTAHGIYSSGGGYINTTRAFSTPMQIGDELRFYWVFNWDANGGNKGFDLRSGGTTIFNVNNGGSAAIIVTGGATADANYGTTPMYVRITRTSASDYSFSMTRRSDGSTYTTTFNNGNAIDGVSFYIGGQNDGSGQRNLYFNGLEMRPPQANDQIYVAMTPSAQTCLTSLAASNSNTVALSSTASTPSVAIQSTASSAVCPGTAVTFSVNTSANMGGAPSYQWKLNGTNISGANAPTYASSSLVNNDQVTLQMTSSLAPECLTASSATSSAVATTVNSSTSITTQPVAASACAGSSASFTVAGAGQGTLTYQWKKNGANITGNATATTSTLTISGIAAGDAANYTVDVIGACGTATSNTAALALNAVTAISVQPVAVTECNGLTATYNVTASGQGTLSYQWRKDGSPISGATNSSYSLAGITSANAGNYSVVVSGGCGNVTSSNAALTVQPATLISSQPSASTICQNNTANFAVTATGQGTLSYQWKLNGNAISGATGSTLAVSNAQAINAGSYTVDITAGCGTTSSNTAALSVNPATSITTQPVGTAGCEGQNTTFTVVAAGTGTLSYQWKYGSTNVGTNAASFNIPSTTTANDGNYSVVVTGGCGNTTSNTVALNVYPSPSTALISTADITGATLCGKNEVSVSANTPEDGSTGFWSVVGNWGIVSTGDTDPTTSFTANNAALGGVPKKLVWSHEKVTSGNSCFTRDTITVDFKQPNISDISGVIQNGDVVWGGLTSTSWSTSDNWYQYQVSNGTGALIRMTQGEPTSTTKVYNLSNADAGVCVSSTNVPALGNGEAAANVYVGDGATLNLSSGTLSLTGDLTNNGTINPSSGTVTFNGTGAQKITGTGIVANFNNLVINKASGVLTLEEPAKVSGTLTMTQGDIVSDATNILEVGTNASSVGSVSWAGGTVRGPMKRWFNSSANSTQESGIFPVGVASGAKAGTNRYAQVNFTSNPGTGGYIVAEYKSGTPPTSPAGLPLNYSSGSYPQAIQNYEEEGYWDITPYSASNVAYAALNSAPYTLKLRLQNPSTLTTGWTPSNDGNDLYNTSTIRMIRAKGSNNHANWELAGTHSSAVETGNGDYYITSSGITEFSWFNGGGNNQNPLPVELVSFTGACDNGVISLTWQTASEFNSSHFDVEKSRDGENWQVLTTMPSAGTSNELITYQSTDQNGTEGNNYFRLRQVDVDGTEKVYDPINVSCSEVTTGYFSSFPNPSGSAFQVIVNNKELIGTCTMNIVDASGKVIEIKEIDVKEGINMFVINQELTPGIYFLNITNGSKSTPVIRHAIK